MARPRLRRAGVFAPWLALALLACSDVAGPNAGPTDLLDRLNDLPGVVAVEIEPHYGYPRAFQIDVTQPVDHNAPNGAVFTQRAYLSHVDETLPMVFGPSGYGASDATGSELAEILQTNGLYVVHRYFPDARPNPVDWQHLNIWQAATDHHRIVELFRQIYPGPWVSTGSSKGGKTALFHRRFYPEDVDATVAYVAPFMFSLDDQRFIPYLAGVSTEEGREAIHAFQRRMLQNRDSLVWRFEDWFADNGWSFSLPAAPVFESRVRGYEWNYWQRHDFDYADIPTEDAPYDEWIDHLARVTRLHFRSDSYRDYFSAYIYQLYTEIGGAAIDTSHLSDLLVEEPLTPQVTYGLPEVLPEYSSATVEDVVAWLQDHGDGILYIYGEVDPWTAGAFELHGGADALVVVQPGADHSVKIAELDQSAVVLSRLGGWLGLDISLVSPRSIAVPTAAIRGEEPPLSR